LEGGEASFVIVAEKRRCSERNRKGGCDTSKREVGDSKDRQKEEPSKLKEKEVKKDVGQET